MTLSFALTAGTSQRSSSASPRKAISSRRRCRPIRISPRPLTSVRGGLRVPCVAMRRTLVPALVLVSAAVIAACGSSSPSSTIIEPTPFQVSPTPVITAAAEPTPTATATASPTPSGPCMPGQFEIAILDTQGAAGTIYATFEIRNASTTDCTEDGYAKLQMLTPGGGLLNTTWSNDNSLASPCTTDLPPALRRSGHPARRATGFSLSRGPTPPAPRGQAERPKFVAGDAPDVALPDRRPRHRLEHGLLRRHQGRPDQVGALPLINAEIPASQ